MISIVPTRVVSRICSGEDRACPLWSNIRKPWTTVMSTISHTAQHHQVDSTHKLSNKSNKIINPRHQYANLLQNHQRLRQEYQKLISVTAELTSGLEGVAQARMGDQMEVDWKNVKDKFNNFTLIHSLFTRFYSNATVCFPSFSTSWRTIPRWEMQRIIVWRNSIWHFQHLLKSRGRFLTEIWCGFHHHLNGLLGKSQYKYREI